MTIASEITRINTNIANAYTACNNKGATMPATQNSANLATCVSSIPTATEPTLASLTVTPSTTAQTLTPPSGTDGYNTVIASAVTASIDNNITAGNIKSGVNILGVSGTVTELVGETRTVSITSTGGNIFTPSSGKNGITSIKCNPTNKALTITPTTTSQTFTVPSNYSGYGTVICNAASGGGGGDWQVIDATIGGSSSGSYIYNSSQHFYLVFDSNGDLKFVVPAVYNEDAEVWITGIVSTVGDGDMFVGCYSEPGNIDEEYCQAIWQDMYEHSDFVELNWTAP